MYQREAVRREERMTRKEEAILRRTITRIGGTGRSRWTCSIDVIYMF